MAVILASSIISAEDFRSSVRVAIGFLVTSLTKAFLAQLFSLARRPTLGRATVTKPFNLCKLDNCFHLKRKFNYKMPHLLIGCNAQSDTAATLQFSTLPFGLIQKKVGINGFVHYKYNDSILYLFRAIQVDFVIGQCVLSHNL